MKFQTKIPISITKTLSGMNYYELIIAEIKNDSLLVQELEATIQILIDPLLEEGFFGKIFVKNQIFSRAKARHFLTSCKNKRSSSPKETKV